MSETVENARVPVEFFGARRQVRAAIGKWKLTRVEDTPAGPVAVYVFYGRIAPVTVKQV